ncbi:MAG: hypothetical protein CFE46_05810 [Burkholderiales bacterium PBB6]|nr:MAG: hypothetical protein CFE46_05810 [Burkholderiales bacterium PBB6]
MSVSYQQAVQAAPLFSGESAAVPRDWPAVIWRQGVWVLACTGLTTVLALAFIKAQVPLYTSAARVWVQTEQQGTPSFLSGITAYRESPLQDPVNRKMETEMELMLSRTSIASVIERLNITEDQLARTPMNQVRTTLNRWLGRAPLPTDPVRMNALVDIFLESVSVAPQRSKTAETASNVLELRLECADRELAPRALAALLENYLRVGAQQNRRLGESTSRLIETKLTDARSELAQVEQRMVDLAMSASGQGALTAGALDGVSAAPRDITPPIGNASLRIDLGMEGGTAGHSQAVSLLRSQTLEMQARLEEMRQLYTDDADNVRSLRERLNQARQRLSQGVREGVRVGAQMARLERERALAQDRYVELQKKYDQIDLYLKLNPTEADSRVVVDAPQLPLPEEGRKRGSLAMLAPLAGLLLGLLVAGWREMTDRRLHGAIELARLPGGLTVLGSLPRLSDAERQQLLGARSR